MKFEIPCFTSLSVADAVPETPRAGRAVRVARSATAAAAAVVGVSDVVADADVAPQAAEPGDPAANEPASEAARRPTRASDRFVADSASIEVRSLPDGSYAFALRSKIGALLVAGECAAPGADGGTFAARVLALAAQPERLRVADTPEGTIVELVEPGGAVLGRSSPMPSPAIAAATLRLIAIQARTAVVVATGG